MQFPKPRSRARMALIAALVMVFAIPAAVFASHRFDDVLDSNEFHQDISWLADNRVTIGCNPPANTEFCPGDDVTRQQMAAFMRRFAGTMGNTGSQVTDDSDPILVDTTDWVELAAVDATARDEAYVTLAGHVYLETAAPGGEYAVTIAADSCEGDPAGVAAWGPTDAGAATTAVTGNAVVDGATTFVLCATKLDDADPDATADMRGITATWSPTL